VKRWLIAGIAVACSSGSDRPARLATEPAEATAPPSTAEFNPRLLRRFRPVASDAAPRPATPEKIALGRRLFHETRLSRNGKISCDSCHPLDRYGADGQPTSLGVDGQRGTRNAPSVYNAASHFAQFWDGRSPTIEDQAAKPIMNGIEMGMRDEASVIAVLEAEPTYVRAFAAAYPDDPRPITLAHLGEAIAAFERGLVTHSRWDDFLAGNEAAQGAQPARGAHSVLTPLERRGLRLFLDSGCMVCHTGPQVGGTMFERVGVVEPWPNQRDPGRSAVTGSPADHMVFKVPSLKNVAMTAPYFHDGSVATLEAAIRMMGRHQLGLELADDEIEAIAAWMRAMTGTIDRAYIEPPAPRVASPRSTRAPAAPSARDLAARRSD
jgi:cytochrome c peroxidase